METAIEPARTSMYQRLTIAKVNELWKLYQESESINYVADKGGVAYNTAKRYVVKGDRKRGIEAFEKRLRKIRIEAHKLSDKDSVVEEAKRQDYMMGAFWGVLEALFVEVDELDQNGEPTGRKKLQMKDARKATVDQLLSIAKYLKEFDKTVKVEHTMSIEDFLKDKLDEKENGNGGPVIDVDWAEVETSMFATDDD